MSEYTINITEREGGRKGGRGERERERELQTTYISRQKVMVFVNYCKWEILTLSLIYLSIIKLNSFLKKILKSLYFFILYINIDK